MYAVVRVQGQQLRVEPQQTIQVPRIEAEVGATVDLDVLAMGEGDALKVGTPLVDGARVTAEVVGHGRGPKIRVYKYKRRKDYHRTRGHRSAFTELKIGDLSAG